TGNQLIMELAGAELRWYPQAGFYQSSGALKAKVAEEVRARGGKPFIVPGGANSVLGIWGYVRAMEEIAGQLPPGPFTFVYPAGSAGSGAGAMLAIKLLGLDARTIGVLTTSPEEEAEVRHDVLELLRATCERFNLKATFKPEEVALVDGSG